MDHILNNIIDRVDYIGTSIAEWYDQLESSQGAIVSFDTLSTSANDGENIGEWFEYVWSTTRGIRKDVTQQQLTDLVSVGLVQKCARFHIMCAERLVEEDSNDFSRKLNDENLTKCLQTLKHMYEDLKNEGVACPEEPEFRCYDVLLNLNDGDTLRSALTLDQWVRDSKDVQFAIDVFMALNSNNYVKFFQLVRKATLLQGCILLRYFYQVRQKALRTIVRAFCPTLKATVQFSLTKLTYLLGFEDVQACGHCCLLHGLPYEVNLDIVTLNRASFYDPEELPDLKRARNLVEAKRIRPWSEEVNGGPLNPNPFLYYSPQNSFNEVGFLVLTDTEKAVLKSTSSSTSAPMASAPTQPKQPSVEDIQKQHKLVAKASASQQICDELILNEIQDNIEDILDEVIDEVQTEEEQDLAAKEIVKDIIDNQISDVASLALREARDDELKTRLRREEMLSQADSVLEDILKEEAEMMIKDVAKEEMAIVKKAIAKQIQNDAATELIEEIIAEEVAKQSSIAAVKAIDDIRAELELNIQKFTARREQRLQGQVFQAWRDLVRRRKAKIEALIHFASSPGNLSLPEQNARLQLKDHKMRWNNKANTDKLFEAIDIGDTLTLQMLQKLPLDLISLVYPALSHSKQRHGSIAWKLVVCSPTTYSDTSALIEKLFRSEANDQENQDPTLLCNSSQVVRDNNDVFSVCVRSVTGQTLEEEVLMSEKRRRNLLLGTRGVLFLHVEEVESEEETRQRLSNLCQSLFKEPALPVHIVTTSQKDPETLCHLLKTQTLMSSYPVSSFNVTYIPRSIYSSSMLINLVSSVQDLAFTAPEEPLDLKILPFREFLEVYLGRLVIEESFAHWHPSRLSSAMPSALVALHNEALTHFKRVLRSPTLKDLSWPIPELDCFGLPSYWNDEMYLDVLSGLLDNLVLPSMAFPSTDTWQDQVDQVMQYFKLIIKPSSPANSRFYFRLRRCMNHAHDTAEKSFLDENKTPKIPWPEIFSTFIAYNIHHLKTEDVFSSKRADLVVGFWRSAVAKFSYPKAWKSYLASKSLNSSTSHLHDSSHKSPEKRQKLSHQLLQDELNQSLCFEEKLRKAMSQSNQSFTLFQ